MRKSIGHIHLTHAPPNSSRGSHSPCQHLIANFSPTNSNQLLHLLLSVLARCSTTLKVLLDSFVSLIQLPSPSNSLSLSLPPPPTSLSSGYSICTANTIVQGTVISRMDYHYTFIACLLTFSFAPT